MKLKEIIGAILMVILSIGGILVSIGYALNKVISSNGIMTAMQQTDYLLKTEAEVKNTLKHYMNEEKIETLLNEINVKSDIKQMTESFNNNTIEQVGNNIKQEMKQQVIYIIDEDVTGEAKESYATLVSEAYIKCIFPVTEFETLSNIYTKYNSKLLLMIIILTLLITVIYIYCATGKKTYKWAIIGLYNIIILNVVLVIGLSVLDKIVVGNIKTTAVIITMVSNIKKNICIATIIVLAIAIFSNYIAYFRKRKHTKK